MTENRRVILAVLDSLGIGHARDADSFFNGEVSDEGADTLGHIKAACEAGYCDGRRYREEEEGGQQLHADPDFGNVSPERGRRNRNRDGPLYIPNLTNLGIFAARSLASGRSPEGISFKPDALVSSLQEVSFGKDTVSGHMEICGLPIQREWGYFPRTKPCFPQELIRNWVEQNDLPGVLGQCHDSGTKIMQRLGREHIRTGKPVVYTSADSVFQVLAHEEIFGLERLYSICQSARVMMDDLNVGRVIARPFTGREPDCFVRTKNRRDFAIYLSGKTLLDHCAGSGLPVQAIGKISDIFNGRGISKSVKARGLPALLDATIEAIKGDISTGLIFTNFVDFDTEFGHRRDVSGYAAALEYFDQRLPEILSCLCSGDLLAITADHGNDPTWTGTDHTREQVPLLLYGARVKSGLCVSRKSFADAGQTLACYLSLPPLAYGHSLI